MKTSIKYSLMKNLCWGIRFSLKSESTMWFCCAMSIVVEPVLALASGYMVRMLMNSLELRQPFYNAVVIICVGCGVLWALTVARDFFQDRIMERMLSTSFRIQGLMYQFKNESLGYQSTESKEFIEKEEHAGRDASLNGGSLDLPLVRDIQGFCIAMLGLVTCGSLIVSLDSKLMLVVVLAALLSFFSMRWQNLYYERNKDKWARDMRLQRYLESLSRKFSEAKEIKLYGMQEWLIKLFEDCQRDICLWQRCCSLRGLWAALLSSLLTLIQNAAAYAFLLSNFTQGKITVGDFVFLFGVIGMVQSYLYRGLSSFAKLKERSEKIKYYRAYFDMQDGFHHVSGAPIPKIEEYPLAIEFRNITFRYEGADKPVLENFSLHINPGEKIAIVGMNGAGKTTLVRLLCGLYLPQDGEILVGGKPITDYSIREYYTLISPVFQDVSIPALTIEEYITSAKPEASDRNHRIEDALRRTGLLEKVSLLPYGLQTPLGKGLYENGTEFSGGENQRLMLARALYKDAPILILDEPTAALDPIAESEIYQKYGELTQEKTSIYISHRLASARFVDRILYIENGKIREIGTHDQLMAQNGEYAKLFRLQSRNYL